MHHVGVMVTDMERSIDWYGRVLGLQLLERRELGSTLLAFMGHGGALIELIQREGDLPTEGRVNHIAFQVDDLGAALARLREAGVDLGDEEPRPIWEGGQVFFFHGPDGEVLELFQPGRAH